MQVNPYLYYNGNCEAAFKFYAKALGGKIDAMITHEGAPGVDANSSGVEEEDHACQNVDRRRGADGVRRAPGSLP